MIDIKFWNRKRVLITGGTGFIGTWMCMMLIELGADVYVLSRNGGSPDGLFVECNLGRKIKVFKGDIRNKSFISRAVGECNPEIVFHLAAQPIFDVANKYPFYTYETNILGTLNVIEACHAAETKRIIFVTSNHWDGKATEGISIYASSKACSEIVIRSLSKLFSNERMSMSIIRMINVVGGGDTELSRIVPYCMDCLRKSKNISLQNPNAHIRFIYVIDAIIMLLVIAQNDDVTVWKMSGGGKRSRTVDDIKNSLIEKFSVNSTIIKPVAMRNVSISNFDFHDRRIGCIHTPFRDAINDTVSIYKLMGTDDIYEACRSIVTGYIGFLCQVDHDDIDN